MIKQALILAALMGISAPIAHAQDMSRSINAGGQCLAQIGDTVTADDKVALYMALDEQKPPRTLKSEFETKTDFEERMRKSREGTRVLKGDAHMEYDAENEHFTFPMFSEDQHSFQIEIARTRPEKLRERVYVNDMGGSFSRTETFHNLFRLYFKPQGRPTREVLRDRSRMIHFGTRNPKKVSESDQKRCGPYGCYMDIVRKNEKGKLTTALPAKYESYFYQDSLVSSPYGGGQTTTNPGITLSVPKAQAEQTAKDMQIAYVFTPAYMQTERVDGQGLRKGSTLTIYAKIYCAMILNGDNKVLKIIPTTRDATVFGPVVDRTPVGTTQPITQQGQKISDMVTLP